MHNINGTITNKSQLKQKVTRSSATTEKQRVSCPHGWRRG